MLPLDPQGLGEATTGPGPHGGFAHIHRQRDAFASRTSPWQAPARLGVAALAIAACVGASAAGVLLGAALQDQVEARPDATEVRKLDALNAPEKATGTVDPQRGPNRADLGGGR